MSDASDIPADEGVLLSNPVLGATPEMRKARLDQLFWFSYGLMGLSIVACLWTIARPRPYQAVIWVDVLLPLLGLLAVAWSRGAITVIGLGRNEPPQIAMPFTFLGLALAMRSLDYPIISVQPALIGGSCVGIALAVLTWLTPVYSRRNLVNCAVILGLGTIYGYGSIVTLDRIMDRSPVQIGLGVVQEKYPSGSRSKAYNIAVQPYGHPEARTVAFMISRADYDAVSEGQKVCVGAHKGAFAIRWFNLQPCDHNNGMHGQ